MSPSTLLTLYIALWCGVLGAVLGSFLDCAAGRYAAGAGWLPRGRSQCAACGQVLRAPDLIPVVSFLLRRGRCRYCGAPIPADCLWAELAGAVDAFLRSRTPRERQIFLRRVFFCDSIAEIAGRFSTSGAAVKSSLRRTRASLRQYLEKEELL